MIDVVEASIADLRAALEAGETTAVELVRAYLDRIDAYDGPSTATALNAVVVRNPDALAEAAASDARRAAGESRGPLEGIAYTAKDSYLVRGLTAAAGSPAFAALVAQRDAFTIERLRAAGAICLGLTNMPPMANGGMQRGVYGRAESPYNADFLTAPFGSGSSNGSGTATAASYAAFGLGEETWSSGRGPASNNALCAYTPSRGVISTRGNWPLVPTMDVVVPHARTTADLLEVLDVIVADDADARGDFWRAQPWIDLPDAEGVRPASYPALADGASVRGLRIGIPRMYIGIDDAPDGTGIGGPTGRRIETRASILALWRAARADLEAAGAEVVEVDFPAVTNYEGDRPGAPTIATRGLVSPEYLRREIVDLSAWAWDDFLSANGDPALDSLATVDGARIFPHPHGALPDRYTGFDDDIAEYPGWVRSHPGVSPWLDMPELPEGLRGLEETRRIDLEDWMDGLGLAAVAFPAVADVGAADMDVDPAAAERGWRNGVWVANGNLAIRHLGIPTVTVPLGTMDDTRMPVGLTFAGRAYDDSALLSLAAAFEALAPATQPRRTAPPRTPALASTPPLWRDSMSVHESRMHDITDETRAIVDLVLDYSRARLLAEDTPLDKPLPAAELTRLAGRTISEGGIGARKALGVFEHVLAPACITTDDPRYLSFIPSAPTKAAAAFDLVVSASALYGGSWLEGAGAVHAENEVLRWLAAEFGLPTGAGGVFVQGGTLGNLSALVAAREAARDRLSDAGGAAGAAQVPDRWRVVCSVEAHSSIASAARVMDVEVVGVPVGDDGTLRGDAVRAALDEYGDSVFAVVATAGSTNFGIVDDIASIADAVAGTGVWLHVDGAYGLGAMLSPASRHRFAGVDRADSLVVDPHKWLFAPFDACALIYRDPELGRRAHTQHAEYLDTLTETSDWSPSDFAAHLTRRARGLPLWFSLATYGAGVYRDAITGGIELAQRIADEIERRPEFTLVRRPQLGVVVFERVGWQKSDYTAWSTRLLDEQHAFVTPSSHAGRTNARFAILNPRTTFADLTGILDTMV